MYSSRALDSTNSPLQGLDTFFPFGINCHFIEWLRVLFLEKSCTFKISFKNIIQSPWTLLPFRTCLSRGSVNQVPKQAKLCPLEIQGSCSADPPPYFSKNRKLLFVITVPKTASNHHITHKSFSVHKTTGPASSPQKQRHP